MPNNPNHDIGCQAMNLSPMNILHLISSRGLYGAERVLINLVKHYDKRKITPYVALLRDSRAPAHELIEKVIQGGGREIVVPCRKWLDLKALNQVCASVRQHEIDLLHCHEMKGRLYGLFVSKRLYLPTLTTHHNWIRNKLSTTVFEALDAFYIRFFNKIIPVSAGVKKMLNKIAIPDKQMTVILNGIDLPEFRGDKYAARALRQSLKIDIEAPIVGIVGRLSIEKGHSFFLEAAQKVLQKNPYTRFIVVGDGELRNELQNQTRALMIENAVHFTGFQKNIADFYALMDICVMPSLLEGTPMALLEAMAAGVPMIASETGGIPRIITNGYNGVLVKPADSQALANAILQLMEPPTDCQYLSTNAQKTIQAKYSATRMTRQYEDEYRRLLSEFHG